MNYEKNIKILTDFEKALGQGEPVNFEIKGSDGELKKVSKEEFANWMTEGKEEENIKTPVKESLVYGASGDIDGITVFTERKGKDGFIRESYYQPRSEEEKKQIIERNKKRRELEKSQKTKKAEDIDLNELAKEINQKNTQKKISPNSDKKEQKVEETGTKLATSQPTSPLNNNHKGIYWGLGLVLLVLISIVVIVAKKRKLKT